VSQIKSNFYFLRAWRRTCGAGLFLCLSEKRCLSMDRNLCNPFDDSAPERLRHMGLLTAEGTPEQDALAVIERLYAGLFYDALFNFYDDMGNVNAICLELAERLGTENPRRSFLNICSAYDAIYLAIPEPVWWMAGNLDLIAHFSAGFIKRLTDLIRQEAG